MTKKEWLKKKMAKLEAAYEKAIGKPVRQKRLLRQSASLQRRLDELS